MDEIEVFADLDGRPSNVGTLWIYTKQGHSTATFKYDDAWTRLPEKFSFEPALGIDKGTFRSGDDRAMLTSIGDSAPDTWGRRLMQRMERKTAAKQGRAVRTLTEGDYLLGVADIARLGALRFRRAGQTSFQSPLEKGCTIPPFVELPRLLSVTEKVLRDEETDEDLLLLFAPGSSLGGARPKASVADKDGHLGIAKFPKDDDDYAIGTWEEVALRLADMAGVHTASHRLEKIAGKAVLLSRRFDRTHDDRRIPFLSAMAMMGFKDGTRGSYPEIVEALRTHGANTQEDVQQLYRRMVFNILASNVDDHLRNHGFLWRGAFGWTLSPAYDLNPVPADVKAHVLCTNINLDEGTCSVDLARESAEYFDISLTDADVIIREVAIAVSQWGTVAARVGAKASEIDRMSSAFDHAELRSALTLPVNRNAIRKETPDPDSGDQSQENDADSNPPPPEGGSGFRSS
jgi:serine/threonine-protein kinase HipA